MTTVSYTMTTLLQRRMFSRQERNTFKKSLRLTIKLPKNEKVIFKVSGLSKITGVGLFLICLY